LSLRINFTDTISLLIEKDEIDSNEALTLTANLAKILKKFENFTSTEMPDNTYQKYDIRLAEGYIIQVYAKTFDIGLINSISELSSLFIMTKKKYNTTFHSIEFKSKLVRLYRKVGITETIKQYPELSKHTIYNWSSKETLGKLKLTEEIKKDN